MTPITCAKPSKFPSARVIYRFLPVMPVRVSALRSLGAYMNVFAIESFMDELAGTAGEDPVAFRLKHLDDPRAREVVSKAADEFGWRQEGAQPGRGRGFAFARYKNLAAYCAVACEIEIEHQTGRARLVRGVAAVDASQVVNSNGLANQIQGAILQSTSWTLYESVTFDETRITSIDWATYPILRFSGRFTSSIDRARHFSAAERQAKDRPRRRSPDPRNRPSSGRSFALSSFGPPTVRRPWPLRKPLKNSRL